MIVYVDVLVVLNFIVNYLILLISARLCGVRISRLRIVLAALAGGLSSLTIFLPESTLWINVTGKLLLSITLAGISGGYYDIRSFFVRLLWMFVVSFVMAGLMLCLILLSGGTAGFYQNGVCYFRISSFQLLSGVTATYVVLLAVQRIIKRGKMEKSEYRVLLTVQGKTGELHGVMDSQNRLIDLFTGTPVIIASAETLGELLPPQVERAMHCPQSIVPGVRMIACTTVAGQNILPAFRPEKMVLCSEARELLIEDVYIAVAAQLGRDGMRSLILNPALTGREIHMQKL